MTKEELEQRISEVEDSKARALSQVNFYAGQESELRYWLEKITNANATPAPGIEIVKRESAAQ